MSNNGSDSQFMPAEVKEAREVKDTASSSVRDEISRELYADMSIFKTSGNADLPPLELVSTADTLALADASQRGDSANDPSSFESQSQKLERDGFVKDRDNNNETVFKTKDGKPDKSGRTEVSLYHWNDRMYASKETYKDGSVVSRDYDQDGNVTEETIKKNGHTVTKFAGIEHNAETLKPLAEGLDAAGLKKAFADVYKQSGGDWSKVKQMAKELGSLTGGTVYQSGDQIKLNDVGWYNPLSSDSVLAQKPAEPERTAPAGTQVERDRHPVREAIADKLYPPRVKLIDALQTGPAR